MKRKGKKKRIDICTVITVTKVIGGLEEENMYSEKAQIKNATTKV